MSEQKYNLSWQSYTDHLRAMMHNMMTSDPFTDVTLVTDDKKSVKAHIEIFWAHAVQFSNTYFRWRLIITIQLFTSEVLSIQRLKQFWNLFIRVRQHFVKFSEISTCLKMCQNFRACFRGVVAHLSRHKLHNIKPTEGGYHHLVGFGIGQSITGLGHCWFCPLGLNNLVHTYDVWGGRGLAKIG